MSLIMPQEPLNSRGDLGKRQRLDDPAADRPLGSPAAADAEMITFHHFVTDLDFRGFQTDIANVVLGT